MALTHFSLSLKNDIDVAEIYAVNLANEFVPEVFRMYHLYQLKSVPFFEIVLKVLQCKKKGPWNLKLGNHLI